MLAELLGRVTKTSSCPSGASSIAKSLAQVTGWLIEIYKYNRSPEIPWTQTANPIKFTPCLAVRTSGNNGGRELKHHHLHPHIETQAHCLSPPLPSQRSKENPSRARHRPTFLKYLDQKPRKCKHRTELMEAELQGKELSCALKPFALVGWFFTYLLNGSCIVFANIMSAPTRRTQDTFFPPTICQLYSQKCRGRCDVLGYTGWRRKAGSSQEMAKQGRVGNSLGRKDEVQGSGQKSIVLNFEKSKESKSKKRYILISKRRSPKSRKASPI